MMRTLRGLAFGCALAVGAGCSSSGGSGSPQAAQESTLLEVADLIRVSTPPNGKAPSKLSDCDRYRSKYSRGYEAVKSGEVVVVWGAKMPGEDEAASAPKNIIAYEKKAETEGGFVLLLNGTVKQMSADEFKAAPKAK